MDEPERDVEPPLHPARVAAHEPVGGVGQPDELEQLVDAALEVGAAEPLDRGPGASGSRGRSRRGRRPSSAARSRSSGAPRSGRGRRRCPPRPSRAARPAWSASRGRGRSSTCPRRSARAGRTPRPRAPRRRRRRAPGPPRSASRSSVDDDRVHAGRVYPAASRVLGRWTSTSTRARSSSAASGSPSRRAGSRRPPTRRALAAEELGGPVVVKAQVLTGGRGKAGGVKLAANAERGRGEGPRDPRARHQRPRRPQALDRARLRDREGVLPLDHVRPRREEAAVHVHDRRAASTSRRSRATKPDALVRLHVDPLEGFQP